MTVYFLYISITSNRIKFGFLNFWDEACWFLSLRFFGLLSSSLSLFPQRFGRYVLRPSSGVCRTREPSRNCELRPLLKPRGSPVLIPLAINSCSSKFREGSRVRQIPEEGRRTYRPKRCENNNKDEDHSPKNLNDKKKNKFVRSFVLWTVLF